MMIATAPSTPGAPATRTFGAFELRRLAGRSAATMLWLAFDRRSQRDVLLALPRIQPVDEGALERWLGDARRGARLHHPNLVRVAEVGVQDDWPFIAVERSQGVGLDEWLGRYPGPQAGVVVRWVCDVLQGLAVAHEAGVAHGDLQLHCVLIDERGGARLMALGAASAAAPAAHRAAGTPPQDRAMAVDPSQLREQRAAAAGEVLAIGVLLHRLLIDKPALDEPDTAQVIRRLAPLGRELLRLPWSTPRPIPEALRAIVDRCTSGQEPLRYRTARALLDALTGWLGAAAGSPAGAVGVLLDRLHSIGHLPALPGLAARVARITGQEMQRTDVIAEQVLDDMALSFELLRTLNTAQVQGTQVQGNGAVLTLRRIVALIGVNGVRLAANSLRAWPGPLTPPRAAALRAELDRVRLACYTAQALRPRGYDAQVVFLVAALQNIGRLMLRYHFADEASQIDELMRPQSARAIDGNPVQPGMSEAAAVFAVLGCDLETLANAVAHHWGLSAEVMAMLHRVPADVPVSKPDSDAEVLRLTASAAIDAVDAAEGIGVGGAPRAALAIGAVAQRYGRALGINARDVSDALGSARAALRAVANGDAPMNAG